MIAAPDRFGEGAFQGSIVRAQHQNSPIVPPGVPDRLKLPAGAQNKRRHPEEMTANRAEQRQPGARRPAFIPVPAGGYPPAFPPWLRPPARLRRGLFSEMSR